MARVVVVGIIRPRERVKRKNDISTGRNGALVNNSMETRTAAKKKARVPTRRALAGPRNRVTKRLPAMMARALIPKHKL